MDVVECSGVQLPLGLVPHERFVFATYFPGPNSSVVQSLQRLCEGIDRGSVYLWGHRHTGKTHLLQATCQRVAEQGRRPFYLPLSQVTRLSTGMLEDLEEFDVVCVDDIETIAGQSDWELTLFHLYNRLHEHSKAMIVAGRSTPRALGLQLTDLTTRLAWGLVFHVKALADDEKIKALQRSAVARGFELPIDVADFLLRRFPRDMGTLFDLLNRLDRDSLAAQRRLTVPFVKMLLGI
ncbi:MAG: DnaA regulatory inactivator Hda [Gammaproteobacteria bacterium]|nr:DnaA regulatory inactivator Hda [Gammaproteobacteria bacterium]MCI0591493.1 DnaA regulatory inactivator Hda [Gammaproteobacteria bacterium]